MTDETITPQPADDLRSALASAFEQSEKPEVTSEKPAAKSQDNIAEPKEAAAEAAAAPKPERERGPDGKFVKKDSQHVDGDDASPNIEKDAAETSKESPDAADGDKATETDDKEPKEGDDKYAALLKPWKAADKEMFKTLAPEAQDFLARRYKDMEGDYTKKLQANAKLRNDYEPVDKIFEPYRDVMKQKGFTPSSLIEAWSNVEKKLNDPQQAPTVIAGLIRSYKVQGRDLANALGYAPQQQQTTAPAEKHPDNPQAQATAVQLPPEVLNRLQQLERTVTGFNNERADALRRAQVSAQEKAQTDIENFKSETDKEGTLLRPHFDDVEQDMLALANAAITAKQPVPSLSQLYEKAVWANPATREKLLTAQAQAAEAKRIAQDKAKAAAARKAAASVTGAPGPGQATATRTMPERGLREQLEAAFDDAAQSAA